MEPFKTKREQVLACSLRFTALQPSARIYGTDISTASLSGLSPASFTADTRMRTTWLLVIMFTSASNFVTVFTAT
jgi:hypothetical protein